MKNLRCFSLFLACFVVLTTDLAAQVVVVPAGGDGDQIAFSVGQAVAGVATGETGSAEIGVQQSYTLAVLGIEELPTMAGTTVRVYPNPTASMLRVDVSSTSDSEVEYTLYSDNGQLLETKRFNPNTPAEIDMTDYPVGTYILRLSQNGLIGAGYQVIKK